MSAAGIGILLFSGCLVRGHANAHATESPEHGSRAGGEELRGGGRQSSFPTFVSGRRQAAIVIRSPHNQHAVRPKWKAAKPQTNRS